MIGWYGYLSSPLTPQWLLVIVGAVAAYYAFCAFHAARRQADGTQRQANAAEDQVRTVRQQFETARRPYVFFDGLSIENFKDGKEPVFIASFRNEGATTATVSTRMTIKLGDMDLAEGIAATTIPAKGVRRQFLAMGRTYSAAMMVEINHNGTPLCVRTHLTYSHNGNEYYDGQCVEYYPWEEPRPDTVPVFVSCTKNRLSIAQPTPNVIDWKKRAAQATSTGIILDAS